MRIIRYPDPITWPALVRRPSDDNKNVLAAVDDILESVRIHADKALFQYARQFDGADLDTLIYPSHVVDSISSDLNDAILRAAQNIRAFHQAQVSREPVVEVQQGIKCWRESRAIDRVGLYIPGGTAPLFSTLLMLAIPAQIAGCTEIIVCSPPRKDGTIAPVIAHTAYLLGIENLYMAGGAQAIGAMAFGTETIPKVDKIFGPGNQYVTAAKQAVQQLGTAIDMPAGPSEVLVIADSSSDPAFVAADLLSQAEHGPDSQVVCVTWEEGVLDEVITEVEAQLTDLPRRDIALKSLENSAGVLFRSAEEAFAFSNSYAPEHLIINTEEALQRAQMVRNAGSVFIGPLSCESMGDYATGTNHTLPTNGFARAYSGVSLDSFVKKLTFQTVDEGGLLRLGPVVETMAAAESLEAHKRAVSIRLKSLSND